MKKILYIGILGAALTFTSCKGFLDINQNPNYPTVVTVESLLPAAMQYSYGNLGYEMQLIGSIWSQHYTQCSSTNQYYSIMNNRLEYSSGEFAAVWRTYYGRAIPTLLQIVTDADAEGKFNYSYVAKILMAFNLHILNSTFDQITFEEAFQGDDNLTPAFHSSAESYKIILDLLKDVRQNYDLEELGGIDGSYPLGNNDYLFKGNLDSWAQFANTLYLKMLLRDFTANKTEIEALLTEDNFLAVDARFNIFVNSITKMNPLYESDRKMLNTPNNLRASGSYSFFLKANADPRLATFGATGVDFGGYAIPENSSRVVLAATDPVYLTSLAETYFLKAEIYARLAKPVDAKANYDLGVTAAFDRWGFKDKAAAFLAAGGAYEFNAAASTEEMIEQVIIQKWIAAIRSQAWDSWFDINRTGYPKHGEGELLNTYSGVLPAGHYPTRFLYPKISSDFNANTPAVKPIDSKLWWHKGYTNN